MPSQDAPALTDWVCIVNADAFAGQDSDSFSPDVGATEVRRRCLERGCGGYVEWRGASFVRSQPTRALQEGLHHAMGSMLWLPSSALAAGVSGSFALSEVASEVHVEGARRVEKLAGLSPEAMLARFAESRPVVLTDAQEGWRARSRWSFDYFAERFGDEEQVCSDLAPFFKGNDRHTIRTVRCTMREFVRYVRGQPNGLRALQRDPARVFYANGWCPFGQFEDLMADASDRLYCVSDSIPRGELPQMKNFNTSLTKVFLGPAGTVSRLHYDTYATHVWLSQIRGRKQFICFPPSDEEHLHCQHEDECDGRTSMFDPSRPDYKAFPNARRATPYSVIVEEGETVVLPSRWWHWAKSLTPSITLMRNFVNETNIQEYAQIRERVQQARVKKGP